MSFALLLQAEKMTRRELLMQEHSEHLPPGSESLQTLHQLRFVNFGVEISPDLAFTKICNLRRPFSHFAMLIS